MEVTRIKLVIVGDNATGKTMLTIAASSNFFPEDYMPGIQDNYVINIQLDGRKFEVALWDTAGLDEYDRLRPLSYPATDVIMLTYSIATRRSFERLHTKWLPEIHQYMPNVPVVLVGTKEDLRADHAAYEWVAGDVDEVPVPLADSLVGRNNIVAHCLTSSKCLVGLQTAIETAVHAALAHPAVKAPEKGLLDKLFAKSSVGDWSIPEGQCSASERIGASCITSAQDSSFYVIGGGSEGHYVSDPVLHFSFRNGQLTVETVPRSDQEKALLRRNFAGACDVGLNAGYIIGGKSGGKYVNDILAINTESFAVSVIPAAPGPAPTPRYGHSVVHWAGRLFLFGGYTSDADLSNELWEFCVTERVWRRLPLDPSIAPRSGHAAVMKQSHMYVFGGKVAGKPSNELLVIDLNQKTPTCQKHTLKKVPASAAPALCDHSASELLLYSEGHIFTLSVPECKATEIKLKVPLPSLQYCTLVVGMQARLLVGGTGCPPNQFCKKITVASSAAPSPFPLQLARPILGLLPSAVHKDIKMLESYFTRNAGVPQFLPNGQAVLGHTLIDWRAHKRIGPAPWPRHSLALRASRYAFCVQEGVHLIYTYTRVGAQPAATVHQVTEVHTTDGSEPPRQVESLDTTSTPITGCKLLGLHGDSIVRFIVRTPVFREWEKICTYATEVAVINWRTGKSRKLEGCDRGLGEAMWLVLGKRYIVAVTGVEQHYYVPDITKVHMWDSDGSYIGKYDPSFHKGRADLKVTEVVFNGHAFLAIGAALYDEQSRVMLMLWDPLDASHPPLRTSLTDGAANTEGCPLYACQVDPMRAAVSVANETVVLRFNYASGQLLVESRFAASGLHMLSAMDALAMSGKSVQRINLHTKAIAWTQDFGVDVCGLHAPYSAADATGSGIMRERRTNRNTYFALLPEDVLKYCLQAYGALHLDVEAGSESAQTVFVRTRNGFVQMAVAP